MDVFFTHYLRNYLDIGRTDLTSVRDDATGGFVDGVRYLAHGESHEVSRGRWAVGEEEDGHWYRGDKSSFRQTHDPIRV